MGKARLPYGNEKRTWQSLLFQKHPSESLLLFWALTSFLLVFVIGISLCHIQSLDIWWHLKTGQWILQQHGIPMVDPFSFSAAGKPWVSHEWLFGLLSYAAYRLGGIAAIVWAKALLITVLFALTAWAARARGALPGVMFLLLTASYHISRFRFTERPELLSLPLALGFILLFLGCRERPWIILLMPCLELLWANIHGGTALLGWVLAGSFFLDRVWQVYAQGIPMHALFKNKQLQLPLLSLAGVIVASFINPHGFKALFYGLLRTESPLDNKEFQSLAAMMNQGIDLSIILFIAFSVLLTLLIVLRPKDVRIYECILFLVLLLLALKFFRFRTFFVLLSVPTLAMQLSRWKWLNRLHYMWPALIGLFLMVLAADAVRSSYFYRFGIGVHSGVFPQDAARFLKESRLSGRMFNTYGMGGYLIWELWPEQKVFIDGREDVYLGPGVLEDYIRCFNSQSDWQKVVNKYGIDFAIVRYPEQTPSRSDRSLDTLAFPRTDWGLVYFDDVAAVYVRRNGKNDSILVQKEIRTVQPLQLSSYLDDIISSPESLQAFSEEMNANLREHPSSFRDHFTLGILAVKRGPQFLNQALREFEQAVALNPDFAPAYVNLGSIYLHLGRFEEAERSLQKALSLEKNPFAEEQLRRLRRAR
jgi:hypothetical protein